MAVQLYRCHRKDCEVHHAEDSKKDHSKRRLETVPLHDSCFWNPRRQAQAPVH